MKINWKIRFKNKAWLVSIAAVLVAFVYQTLGLFDVVPPVSEDQIVGAIGLVINLLVGLGVVIDPTTSGMQDSERAMSYQ